MDISNVTLAHLHVRWTEGYIKMETSCFGSALPKFNRLCTSTLLFAALALPMNAQTFSNLANFTADTGDPDKIIAQGADGNFYGTTENGQGAYGNGSIFRVTPDGTVTTVYSFGSNGPGGNKGGLIPARDGNLYGTTYSAFYRLTTGGAVTTLATFPFNGGESELVQGA